MQEFEGPKSIEIKRNPKVGYFGITSYPKSTTTLSCQIGKRGYNTGLTPEEESFYEKKLDLKPGELSKNSKWWGEVFNVGYPIRLFNTKTTEFYLDDPMSQIKYKVLLAHSDVANSEMERNKPGILFYIDDKEAKAKEELKTINFELEGMKLILSLTSDEVKGTLRLFGKPSAELMSTDVCQALLMQEMKKNPKQFFDIITDKELKNKIFVYELLDKKILTRKGNAVKYGDDTIGNSLNEACEWVIDVKNQSTVLALQTKLKKVKKEA
jgi:hypothetical protein